MNLKIIAATLMVLFSVISLILTARMNDVNVSAACFSSIIGWIIVWAYAATEEEKK